MAEPAPLVPALAADGGDALPLIPPIADGAPPAAAFAVIAEPPAVVGDLAGVPAMGSVAPAVPAVGVAVGGVTAAADPPAAGGCAEMGVLPVAVVCFPASVAGEQANKNTPASVTLKLVNDWDRWFISALLVEGPSRR